MSDEGQVEVEAYQPENHVRVVTATSLFDGHDAAINIMRRILQATGVEVIHLGHNRSVEEIVRAAVEEDVQAVAVSCYQGGHMEFFKYIVDRLAEYGASHIKVFGGGGGVIVPEEIRELEAYGVARIYSPEDGTRLGLQGIINHLVRSIDVPVLPASYTPTVERLTPDSKLEVARIISALESAHAGENRDLTSFRSAMKEKLAAGRPPVVGITGTGGAGKSSLTDELILRFLHDIREATVAVISVDPSRRKTGGALLGDRIRMNAIGSPRVYMRSLATRGSRTEISEALADAIQVLQVCGFDLVIVETAGIGQGDTAVVDLVDASIYVMTPEFGASSQLEKIDMLDYADLVAVNKFEKRGGEDAVRDVRKQVQRNRATFQDSPEEMPVFGTIASKFNDNGVTALYRALLDRIEAKTGRRFESGLPRPDGRCSTSKTIIIPPERTRYLSEISDSVRAYHRRTEEQADAARRAWHLEEAARALAEAGDSGDAVARRGLRGR